MFLLWALAGEAAAADKTDPAAGANPPHSSTSWITEALRTKLPKFVPPAPAKEAEPAPAQEADVLQLPKVTVHARTVVPESDYAWLNERGRLELAIKAHPGIRVGNFFGLNNGIARAMQSEERAAAKKADMAERVDRVVIGNSANDQKIRQLTKALLLRSATDREFP